MTTQHRFMLGSGYVLACASFCAWVCVSEVKAQPSAADALLQQGVELRKQARDADALTLFQQAYELSRARARAQVALAHQALGEWVAAEQELMAALEESADAWIALNRKALDDALAAIRDNLATLEIDCDAPGATLAVNGVASGSIPLAAPLRVAAGTVQLELRMEPSGHLQRELQVPARETVKVTIMVAEHEPARPIAAVDSTHATPPDISVRQPSLVQRDTKHALSGSELKRSAWIGASAAALALATAIVSHIVREVSAAHYDDDSRCFHGGLTRDQRCGSYRSTADAAQAVAIAAYATGVTLLGVSVPLMLSAYASSPSLDRAGAYLELRARF